MQNREERRDVEPAMCGGVRREPARRFRELPSARDAAAGDPCVVPRDRDVDEPLEEIALPRIAHAPRVLERFVGDEVISGVDELEPPLVPLGELGRGHAGDVRGTAFPPIHRGTLRRVATILVAGVDLFFRGKLDALLGSQHKLVTTDHVDDPDLVIVDVARVDPDEVAEEYPDIPILGFTNHTDTAGLRAAQAAGFDRVVARSALAERAPQIVEELVP